MTHHRRSFHMTCRYCRTGKTSDNCCGCGRKGRKNGESGTVGSYCGTGGSGGGAGNKGKQINHMILIGVQVYLFLLVFLVFIRLLLGLLTPPSLFLFALPSLHSLCRH